MPERNRKGRADRVSLRGREAMRRYGFDRVPLGRPGSPTPGRVADILADLAEDLHQGISQNDLAAIRAAYQDLDELRLALDAWGIGLMSSLSNRDCQSDNLLNEEPE